MINDKLVAVELQKNIFEACKGARLHISILCRDEKLETYGACRFCIEIQGMPRPLTAFTTQVSEGMEITTESGQLTSARRAVLPVILSDHLNDSMVCGKSELCDLHEFTCFLSVLRKNQPRFAWLRALLTSISLLHLQMRRSA
jgi:NADH dehydrogenase/NADH:ubiquinone oxidoreductase subunit G